MNQELQQLQIQITQELHKSKLIISNIEDILDFLPHDYTILAELELAKTTICDMLLRLSNNIDVDITNFLLCVKQIQFMTDDLINNYKQKIKYSA